MLQNYDVCLKEVLKHEGGYVNNPKDPGGATNKGVTQRVYDAYRKRRGEPVRSVRLITDYEVSTIYRLQYWAAVRGDLLPSGIDFAVFDYAVNSGPVKAISYLQDALGLKVDGHFGEVTLQAVRECDSTKTINRLMDARLAFMKRVRHPQTKALLWATFGKGWGRRIADVRSKSLAMISMASTTVFVEAPQNVINIGHPKVEAEMGAFVEVPVITPPTLWERVKGWFV